MNVETFLSDWLTLRSSELKPRTIESYRDLIDRYVTPSIGDLPLEDLQPDPIRHLLAQIVAAGHTRTAELVFVMLKCAFMDLEVNPMFKIKRPKHKQVSPPPWRPSDAAVYLRACLTHPHGLALSLGLFLGLRRGEICGLRWQDVDLDANVIHIINQRVRLATGEIIDCTPKSDSSVRDIPIPDKLLPLLKQRRGLPEAYLCSLTPSGIDGAHRALVKSLGLPYTTLHGLRHTMATNAIRNGASMRGLQSVLGHASYSTTANRYTHPDQKMQKKVVDAAAAF